MLELITVLEKKGKNIQQGKIKISFDNRKGHDKIVKQIHKCNACAQEARAEVAIIKKLLQKIQFKVKTSLEKECSKRIGQCQTNLLKHLLKEYNKTSREVQEKAREK